MDDEVIVLRRYYGLSLVLGSGFRGLACEVVFLSRDHVWGFVCNMLASLGF